MRAASPTIRSAYTLMELILVVVILVAIAGISVPVLQTMLTDTSISASADQVQGLFAEARARAMDDGRAWKIGFRPGTGAYQLAPEDSQEWENLATGEAEAADYLRGELPKEILFALTHEEIISGQASQGSGNWETIAVFLPNGSARDDTTVYFGKGGIAPMRAVLRGLTGSVAIEQFTRQ